MISHTSFIHIEGVFFGGPASDWDIISAAGKHQFNWLSWLERATVSWGKMACIRNEQHRCVRQKAARGMKWQHSKCLKLEKD